MSKNISVSKFWNIGIGGQSNIGNWPNTEEKVLKISVSVSKKKRKNISRSFDSIKRCRRFERMVSQIWMNMFYI